LPENIGQLSKLRDLDLEGNYLKTLPKSFGQLKQLQELNLDYNQLEGLPKEFCNLKSLWRIWIAANLIQELPDSIGQLINLKYLYADFNQLTTIPKSFKQLKNLKRANFQGNPLEDGTADHFRFAMRHCRFDFRTTVADYSDLTTELFLIRKYQRAFDLQLQASQNLNKDIGELYGVLSVFALFVNQPQLSLQNILKVRQIEEELDEDEGLILDFVDFFAFLMTNQYAKAEALYNQNRHKILFTSSIFILKETKEDDLTWEQSTKLLIEDLQAAGIDYPTFEQILNL
jgi:hypothetical protein